MEVNRYQKIIVLGAARSGTSLIAELLQDNLQNVRYFCEIREIWEKEIKPISTLDFISKKMYDQNVVLKLREYFDREMAKGQCKTLLEKTACNVFRVPLVYDVFPDARFVHIIRDGRDVAISARKKMQGNINHLSKIDIGPAKSTQKDRIRIVTRLVGEKFRYLNLKNFPRYLNGLLSLLGVKKRILWGPRFFGMEECSRLFSDLQLCALQWKLSVESVRNFFALKPKYYEIHFEGLIKNPKVELENLFAFLEIPLKKVNIDRIDKRVLASRNISEQEEQDVMNLIRNTLVDAGYL